MEVAGAAIFLQAFVSLIDSAGCGRSLSAQFVWGKPENLLAPRLLYG